MFMSHKDDAPLSCKQPFIDTSVSSPPSTASSFDPWASESLDSFSYGVMRSPERSHRAHSSKRSSVFNLRSRSNTGTSTTSTVLSSSPSMAIYEDTSRPGTALTYHQHEQAEHQEPSGYRISLFRSKRGKRLSESVSLGIGAAEYEERDMGDKRSSVLRKVRRRNNQADQPADDLKHRISSPFDFQHLTHADREGFASFEHGTGDKLASGFRAARSSHTTHKDTVEDTLGEQHFVNLSAEDVAAQELRSLSAASIASPPRSPQRFPDLQHMSRTTQDHISRPSLRQTRSVDSFSRPGVRSHRHSQSVLVPTRLSSLSPLAAIDDIPEDVASHTRQPIAAERHCKRESGIWDSFSLATTGAEAQLPGLASEPYFGHALTTPDDTALPAMPPSFSPSLDDVAEEPERFSRPRRAPQPPTKGPTTPKSPQFDTSIFNGRQSPATKARSRGNSNYSPRSAHQRYSANRPLSQASDTLGSSAPARRGSVRKPNNRRQSNTWRAPEASWEDDIDYIYEHALEADCDFEWDEAYDLHRSNANSDVVSAYSNQPPKANLHTDFESSLQYKPRDFRVSLLVPDVPDLVPTSATSFSTMGTGLATPSDSYHGRSMGDDGSYVLSPSLLVPQEYKEDTEHTYEDLLNAYGDSERHFPMLDPRYSATSSARSRRSSYDSSLMSSAQSSGMWSSPIRRSASSAGSIPDLIPSRRTRRELGFSLVVDHLSESIASLSHLDEEKEDDDATPPGRVLKNRTFFPAAEETEQAADPRIALEDELRASLELARHGSQRSTTHVPARHHKQIMSDGAAKLLITASVAPEQRQTSRSRAATASQAAKSPMLSLFPAPPRHSPRI
ncbi:hypothetical protein DE146DRAFT_620933 [Phaeosphaeria sp. MPI-PUGE-AT-0046c]|nr:hypothetical protein DE146DRAFT_620933 [Phaeosphaeria sp. MPI-PUGE-AT-0046c]